MHELATLDDTESGLSEQVAQIHRAPGVKVLMNVSWFKCCVVPFAWNDEYRHTARFQDAMYFDDFAVGIEGVLESVVRNDDIGPAVVDLGEIALHRHTLLATLLLGDRVDFDTEPSS